MYFCDNFGLPGLDRGVGDSDKLLLFQWHRKFDCRIWQVLSGFWDFGVLARPGLPLHSFEHRLVHGRL